MSFCGQVRRTARNGCRTVRTVAWLRGFWGIGWRAFVEGGDDGSERQVDAGGGGNRDGDRENRSQGASGGQGGVDRQAGAGGYRQAGGGLEAAVAEDDEAAEAGVALGERAKRVLLAEEKR